MINGTGIKALCVQELSAVYIVEFAVSSCYTVAEGTAFFVEVYAQE